MCEQNLKRDYCLAFNFIDEKISSESSNNYGNVCTPFHLVYLENQWVSFMLYNLGIKSDEFSF